MVLISSYSGILIQFDFKGILAPSLQAVVCYLERKHFVVSNSTLLFLLMLSLNMLFRWSSFMVNFSEVAKTEQISNFEGMVSSLSFELGFFWSRFSHDLRN